MASAAWAVQIYHRIWPRAASTRFFVAGYNSRQSTFNRGGDGDHARRSAGGRHTVRRPRPAGRRARPVRTERARCRAAHLGPAGAGAGRRPPRRPDRDRRPRPGGGSDCPHQGRRPANPHAARRAGRARGGAGPAGIGSAALCLPMPGQTGLAGLLYLENAAAPLPFSAGQLEVLTVLAAQAALALDTARRMAALVAENAARRRIEQALRESQAMLVLGEQISQSGSWSWRPGQAALDCTAQFCRMFGLGDDKVAVPFEAFLARVHGDDRERVRQQSSEAVAQGLPFLIEYRAFDGAGSLRFISAAGRPLTPPRGEYGVSLASAAYVGTAVDVTERRAFEDNLRQAQAELARVARLTTVGQLTASIAHEVNQPL